MLSLDIRHPDVLEFIKSKVDLSKITGANISVRVNNEFFEAVKNDKDFYLKFSIEHPVRPGWSKIAKEYNKLYHTPQDGNVYFKKVKAKELWQELVKVVHKSAEPGMLNWDRMINYAPDGVYNQYKPISTNP